MDSSLPPMSLPLALPTGSLLANNKNRTVAVTGASGAVGRAIVPELIRMGFRPILFGRNPAELAAAYPEQEALTYDELPERLDGCRALIQLAVGNPNAVEGLEVFNSTNVAWTSVDLAVRARECGVRRIIQLSLTDVIDENCKSYYSLSRQRASQALHSLKGIGVSEIIAPKVYNSSQSSIQNFLWRTLGALKPTLASSQLASAIIQELGMNDLNHRTRLLAKEMPRPKLYSISTAIIDIFFAISVIILFSWLMALIAIAIRLDSKGPAFFRQVRIGRNRKPFICWKFRTMHVGTVNRATHETGASSVTRVGGFLRRTKLDELPQIVNLLRRELSLVGPRPCLPNQRILIEERNVRGVFTVLPGITGLAQVNQIDMSEPVILATWDERYIALRSILCDFKILLRTFVGSGAGDRVDCAS